MNMNSILNMIMRQIVRKFVSQGVNAGFKQAGKVMDRSRSKGPKPQDHDHA
ncbi:MAG: hypothetical protein HRU30_18850 [Rhodobacteraceae bacterium]|nr:hypothetical protein [Paracoccaceae bacterium]